MYNDYFMQLSYDFQLYLLLQEPLLVVTALLILFLTVIICVRLDFSIAEVVNIVHVENKLLCYFKG